MRFNRIRQRRRVARILICIVSVLLGNGDSFSGQVVDNVPKFFTRTKVASTTTTKAAASNRWNHMIDRLTHFRTVHGHSFVQEKDDADLNRWVSQIRHNYRHQVEQNVTTTTFSSTKIASTSGSPQRINNRPRLSAKKLSQLQALHFVWNANAYTWNAKYEQLVQFHTLFGHSRVPKNCAPFPKLGVWVQNQRREYKKLLELGDSYNTTATTTNKNNKNKSYSITLTPDRLRRLEKLDFEWFKSHKSSWEFRFQQLREHLNKLGTANVKQEDPKNSALGRWCMNQRTLYRLYMLGEPSSMTIDRITKLDSIGFRWNLRQDVWHSYYQQLVNFYDHHGHANIPSSHSSSSSTYDTYANLRFWLTRQRFEYGKRKEGRPSPMTLERIRLIEKAVPNFRWRIRGGDNNGPSTDDWARLFAAMRAKGIEPQSRPKSHWFEGSNPFECNSKHAWTEQDLLMLWNQEAEEYAEEDDMNSKEFGLNK